MNAVLNPNIRLRKNKNRIVILKIDKYLGEVTNIGFIHPLDAVFLAMFNGEKTYEEVLKDYCYIIDAEYNRDNCIKLEEKIDNIKSLIKVDKVIMNIEEAEKEGTIVEYKPEEFIIEAKDIKLNPFDKRLDAPVHINFNVSTKCSFDCKYCYHPRQTINEYISLERIEQMFDEAKELGVISVTVSGGDPFERPDILKILHMLYQRGLGYFISTKSYLDEKTCKYMAEECGLNRMQVSLDSHIPEVAKFLVGGNKHYFEDTINTVKNLQKHGIEVRLKAVLTSYNIDHAPDYMIFARDLGVARVQLVSYSRTIWCHDDKLFPSDSQIERYNRIIEELKEKFRTPILMARPVEKQIICSSNFDKNSLWKSRSVCNAGRFGLTILPTGEVSICEHLEYSPEAIIGDLRQMSIIELWESERLKSWLMPPSREMFPVDSPCYTCKEDVYNRCHKYISRCLKDSYNIYRSYYAPDVRCPLAEIDEFRLE